MKRLVVLLLVLVVIGAVVFYFGWIQIKLDEDSYAVIFTKTGGWEESVIPPGQFTWRAARLLPTNLSLHVIPIQAHMLSADLRGDLPGADTYATLLETGSPFSYAMTLDIVYTINPDALPRLVRNDGLREDGISEYYRRTDAAMEQFAVERALRLLDSPGRLVQPASAVQTIGQTLQASLERQYSALSIVSVTVTRLEMPDVDLYLQAKDRYLYVLNERADALAAAAREIAADQTVADAGLARLERYGAILERYPILLDYFTLSQEAGGEPIDLESLVPQPGT